MRGSWLLRLLFVSLFFCLFCLCGAVACARGGSGASFDADGLGDRSKAASTGNDRSGDASLRGDRDAAALSAPQAAGADGDAGDDAGSPPPWSAPPDDADATPPADADGAAPGPGPPVLPAVGDLVITEVMAHPSDSTTAAEWFEIANVAAGPRTLSGLTIEDGLGDTDVIAATPPVVLAPGEYAVFARSRAAAAATGIPLSAVAYEYSSGLSENEGIVLDTGPLGELSLWNGSTELAYVPYGAWEEPAPGQSIELAQPVFTGSARASSWCFASAPWATDSDWGTPGAASDCP